MAVDITEDLHHLSIAMDSLVATCFPTLDTNFHQDSQDTNILQGIPHPHVLPILPLLCHICFHPDHQDSWEVAHHHLHHFKMVHPIWDLKTKALHQVSSNKNHVGCLQVHSKAHHQGHFQMVVLKPNLHNKTRKVVCLVECGNPHHLLQMETWDFQVHKICLHVCSTPPPGFPNQFPMFPPPPPPPPPESELNTQWQNQNFQQSSS